MCGKKMVYDRKNKPGIRPGKDTRGQKMKHMGAKAAVILAMLLIPAGG